MDRANTTASPTSTRILTPTGMLTHMTTVMTVMSLHTTMIMTMNTVMDSSKSLPLSGRLWH